MTNQPTQRRKSSIFEIVGVICATGIGLLLVGVGYLQYTVYTQQAASFIVSDRAYVMISDIHFEGEEPSESQFGIILTIKNVGRHIARDAMLFIDPGAGASLPVNPVYLDENRRNLPPVIVSGLDVTVFADNHRFPDKTSMTQLIVGIRDGAIPFRVWGKIMYDTGYPCLGTCGETGFCWQYRPLNRRPKGVPQFEVCNNPAYVYTH